MKRLDNTKANRLAQCEKENEIINNDLMNPDNFVKNKYFEEAQSVIQEKKEWFIMAVDSPMSNFNRKNPYVIQAKREYGKLMDMYEKISKTIILAIIGCCFILISNIFSIINNQSYWFLILDAGYIGIVIWLTNILIKDTIKDTINKEIDHMVTLESNEILNISIEYVQELLYKIHECIGKVSSNLNWYIITISAISIVMTLVTIVLFL